MMMKKNDTCCPLVANAITASEFLSEIEMSNSSFGHCICCSLYNMYISVFTVHRQLSTTSLEGPLP